ncbi:MAG TPA: S9 family peptidase [Nevskiaceae bacterium]|nr:S9 family peptidase [Nevskiaceae bacterium]
MFASRCLIPAVLGLLPGLLGPSAVHAAPMSAEVLVRLERVSAPALSPQGDQVVYALRRTDLDAGRGITQLWVTPRGTPRPRALTQGEASSSGAQWGADGSVYFLSRRGGSQQVWRLPAEGGEAQPVTDYPLDVVVFRLSPDQRRLALSLAVFPDCTSLACSRERIEQRRASPASGVLHERLFVRHWDRYDDGTRQQLFVAELDQGRAGEPRPLSASLDGDVPSQPFGDVGELVFSPDSRQLVFSIRAAGREEAWSTNFDLYQVAVDGSQPPRNLTAGNPAWDTAPRFTPDGRQLVYLAMRRPGFEADRYAVRVLDLASGRSREVAPDWDRSAAALALSADGRTAFVTADDLGQHRLFAIDLARGSVRTLTGDGHVGGFSVGRDRLVYTWNDLHHPDDLYELDLRSGRSRRLTHHNQAALQDIERAGMEAFRFPGWNGETVHGHLMKPVGFREGQRYPVAFIIHGGPQGSMGNLWHYRWNPAVFSGMGYAVVFIDFHGSTGYGQAFTDSISGDWGGKPLEDLQKGWAYALARYPFLDGSRACALGASYGGYMINWIAGQWPEAFRCLVNHDGIFDTRSMGQSTEELWFTEWEFGGTPSRNPAGYERHNPSLHVEKWRTPMLVIQGELDFRVPTEQSLAAFNALQRRGIPSQLLRFPDENHWVLKPHNSLLWHRTVKAWLDRWTAAPP